ncbi:MAG: HAD-IA family hydrolase [Gemmatimonadota bacterium]
MPAGRGRLVVFDVTGTLLTPAGSVGAVYADAARAAGGAFEAATLDTAFGRALGAAPPLAFGHLGPGDREAAERDWWRGVARSALGALPPAFGFDPFFDRVWRHFSEPRAWRVYPEVRLALRALRRTGHPLAVLSNWDSRLPPLLEALRLGGYFARVLVSSALPAAKPDPAAFAAATTALDGVGNGVPIMVGDRLDHDVLPARAAGWDAVWLDRRGDAAPPGIARVTDLRDLARDEGA